MTKTQLKVLQQAVRTAAAWLHAEGLGLYEGCLFSGSYYPAQFKIWSSGRKALHENLHQK